MKAQTDYSKYIVPAGIVIGGYLILKNLGFLGGGSAAQNQNQLKQTSAGGVNAAIQADKNAGGFATITQAQAASSANVIFNAGTADPVDQDTIVRALIQANTLQDLLLMIQA